MAETYSVPGTPRVYIDNVLSQIKFPYEYDD